MSFAVLSVGFRSGLAITALIVATEFATAVSLEPSSDRDTAEAAVFIRLRTFSARVRSISSCITRLLAMIKDGLESDLSIFKLLAVCIINPII